MRIATGKRASIVIAIALLLMVLFCRTVSALDPDKAITQYRHTYWTMRDGLPQNSVLTITQTRDGYLWIGTEGGLARFDGVQFTTFSTKNTPVLKENWIFSLLEDSQGRLWIGTSNGLYSCQNGVFTSWTQRGELLSGGVNYLFEDRQGRLFVCCRESPLCIVMDDRIEIFRDKQGNSITDVFAIHQDSEEMLWFSSSPLHTMKDGLFERHPIDVILPNRKKFSGITGDGHGGFWLGTLGDGLIRGENPLIPERQKYHRYTEKDGLGGDIIQYILLDKRETLWFGTDGPGLSRYRDGVFETDIHLALLSNSNVISFFEDRDGNLWIGTNGSGLHQLTDATFTTFSVHEGFSSPYIQTVLADRVGTIHAGSVGGGLFSITKTGEVSICGPEQGLSHSVVMSLCERKKGGLWVGTAGGGLDMVVDGKVARMDIPGIPDIIFSLLEDDGDRLWIGSLNSIRYLENDQVTVVEEAGKRTTCSAIDGKGGLWIGAFDEGLIHYSATETKFYTTQDGLSHTAVLSLLIDQEETLWIATFGGGLNRLKNGRFSVITTQQGLAHDNLYSILEDDSGYFWMSCSDGVFRVSKSTVNDQMDGRIQSITCRLYNQLDGMRNSECNGGQQPAAWKDQTGKLWFPTIDGIVVVDPADLAVENQPPPIIIERIQINDEIVITLQGQKSIHLEPDCRRLEIAYTAPDFRALDTMHFRYRLAGFDDDWTDAEQRRIAYFTNIPPGRYRFQVLSRTPDGVWSGSARSLELEIDPLFHQTRTFKVLSILLIALSLAGIYSYRVRKMCVMQNTLARLVDERTAELMNTQRKLEDMNRTLEKRVEEGIDALRESERLAAYGQTVAGVAHEVRQPIFALQAASHVLLTKLKEIPAFEKQCRVLDRETQRMSILMEELLDYAKPPELLISLSDPLQVLHEALESFRSVERRDSITVSIESDGLITPIAMDRHRMIQIVMNLMDNAWKHATGLTDITLRVSRPMDENGKPSAKLIVQVANNGKPIDPDCIPHLFEPFFGKGHGTGLGLAIVHRIVQMHGGEILVESTNEKGTIFSIVLPVDNTEKEEPCARQ